MKHKFIAAAVEITGFNLLALFLVYRLFISARMEASVSKQADEMIVRGGLLIFAAIYIIGMLLIGLHIYFSMVKPVNQAQENLKKAAEESRKAELIRKEFVANVSHELKTPLTSISGFIETLQQGAAEDPEIRTKFIDIIAIETSRLKRLIEDLLVLSDIENKKESADEREFSVKEAIERTIQTLEPIAKEKQVTLLTELDETAVILGSVDRFCQMMVNLIENAIKYSDREGRVWIQAQCEDGQINVSVRDEGIGIAEEHLDRLFERFYRVDKSRSTKAGGTGLGLSIVKHIAALFNAELKVESQVGEGTVFYVTFER
ncbi:hypothetical protein LI177_06610 [bacterium 210820-DFI.6.37]|nr:hypothetical protein [bacterium 210820-DFI.6.37]